MMRLIQVVLSMLLVLGFMKVAAAQTAAPPKCGPDHAIIYKRAVSVLDKAEKKLNTGYTAEAKSLIKEAKSLFAIIQKECGPEQKERLLTEKETQQEAINQKLAAGEQEQADRLMKSAEEKEKKSAMEGSQPELSLKYQREAKEEYNQAHKRYIKAGIYALRNEQMVFSFLGK